MKQTRREALLLGGSGLATALAGCQESSSSNDLSLNLTITNYTPTPQEIEVKLVDPSKDEASEAFVYSTTNAAQHVVEIAPEQDGDEDSYTVRRFEDVATLDTYTVYATLPGTGPDRWRHFHYIPSEDRGHYEIFIRIYHDEGTNRPVIEFDNI